MSLNIKKSSYVIFHPFQKKISTDFNLVLDDDCRKKERSIKYPQLVSLWIQIYYGNRILSISKKNRKRSLGILSKICYYVDNKTLTNLYYTLIHPFLIYGIIAWGNVRIQLP